jgi:hypothetical protein
MLVSKLEDCTKQQMTQGVNQKYLVEKLANVIREEACGGLVCGDYLSSSYCVEIQATNRYRNVMEVAKVMDLGSGQLNISGLELLGKGIEGDKNGRVKAPTVFVQLFRTCLVFRRSPQYILYGNRQNFFPFQWSTSTAKFVTCTTLQTSFQHPDL